MLFFTIDVKHLIFFTELLCSDEKNTTCPVQTGDVSGSAIFVHHHWLPVTTMHFHQKIKIKSGLLVLVRGYLCTPIVSHKQSSPNKNLLFLCAGNVHVEPYSKYLEGQQHASLFNQKMFFKFHPAKFEKWSNLKTNPLNSLVLASQATWEKVSESHFLFLFRVSF